IGDVDGGAIDASLLKRRVEQRARRPDKRSAGKVLLVTRLLADKHDGRVERALAEDSLSCVAVKIAACASPCILQQRLPRCAQVAAGLNRAFGIERVSQAVGDDIRHYLG